jgi:lysophospholipase L1-like esterase
MQNWRACKLAAALVVVLAGVPAGRAAGDDFFFKPKDRIVFLGDSITEQYEYSSFIEFYLVTRFPQWELTFYNAGISGDTAGGGLGRVDTDVLSEHPTAVTINFGMNYGGYRGPDQGIYDNYIKNQDALVKKLTDAKVRVALMSTSPVEGRKRKDGDTYNDTLGSFCKGLKLVADNDGALHVDQFHSALAVLHQMTEDRAAFDCFPDSVHTNSRGGLLMAWSILTALHAPGTVSDLALEADGKVTAAERCKVSGVTSANGRLSFTRSDEALPLVLAPEQKQLLPYLDNLSALNRYGLKVSGLDKDGKYELKIDGKKVAELAGADLDKGVNLALDDLGPITAQAADVRKALASKNQLLHWRFNTFRRRKEGWPPILPDPDQQRQLREAREQELAVADRILEGQRKKIGELAQPKPHQFELSRAQ